MEISNSKGRWSVNEGDLILIKCIYGGKPRPVQRTLGRFEGTMQEPMKRGGPTRDYLILGAPHHSLNIIEVDGISFPTITPSETENTRAIDFITEIYIGREDIAERLPQIHPAYASYVPFIKQLAESIKG
ncbi:hypothetical protein COU60_01950 [Candidatus Pacearchaeota archaeon CG10_big_fil_rev_8_21_14_0_10_34_76]|nr:MAG: hypothetical protein COU60_01950 [Candidatus Pacearchaeota archaeon CG10_big_fil_rev_8_21_14_0_10_34_76]